MISAGNTAGGSFAGNVAIFLQHNQMAMSGGVAEPDRCIAAVGWLVWRAFPHAAFTRVKIRTTTEEGEKLYLARSNWPRLRD
jgi:hypothetical protein